MSCKYIFDEIKWIIAEDNDGFLKIIPYVIIKKDLKVKDLLGNAYFDYDSFCKYECEPILKKYNIENQNKSVSTDGYTVFCLALFGFKEKLSAFFKGYNQEEVYNNIFKKKSFSQDKIKKIAKLAEKSYIRNLSKSDEYILKDRKTVQVDIENSCEDLLKN